MRLSIAYLDHRWDGVSMLTRTRESNSNFDGDYVMKVISIPKTYIYTVDQVASRADVIQASIRRALEAVSKIADHTVLFISPVYLQGFSEQKIDTAFMEAYIGIAMQECRRHARVTCLDLTDAFATERSYFYNVTHLNRAGSEKLARILAKQVGPSDGKSFAVTTYDQN